MGTIGEPGSTFKVAALMVGMEDGLDRHPRQRGHRGWSQALLRPRDA